MRRNDIRLEMALLSREYIKRLLYHFEHRYNHSLPELI